jgi:hypothetical protein
MTITSAETDHTADDRPGFTVHDRATLEWFVQTLTAKRAQIATIRAQAQAMVADLERAIQRLEFLYGAQAQRVTRQLLEGTKGNSKHVKTFFGNAGFRATPARLEIVNGSQSLEWARTHAPEVVREGVDHRLLSARFEPAPDGSSLIDRTDGTTATLPGVRVTPAVERFYVCAPETPDAQEA